MLSRRDLLAAFLGTPAALWMTGCGNRREAAPIAGELVGASDGVGHRLRDLRAVPAVSDDRWEKAEVVIVGAGIAGLSAARRLRQNAWDDFVVLELESEAGGTSRATSSYPWGAHYLPAPMRHQQDLIQLLSEMQLFEGVDQQGDPVVREEHLCRDPQERVFFRGRWMEGLYLHAGESADDVAQLARFQKQLDDWVGWRDQQGRRAFAIPMATCSDDSEALALDKISMADWLRDQGFTSQRLWWLVDYSCRDDYGLTVEQTSAWAGLFYFCARVSAAGQDSRPFMTWPEGNGRLVKHLKKSVGDRLATSRAVVDINPPTDDDPQALIEVVALDGDGKAWGYRAKHVIFAAPRFLTKYIVRPWRGETPQHVGGFTYGSWVVANLVLRDRPASRGFPLSWDNVIYDSPSLGYVTATHQALKDYGPTVLTYYYPLCDDSPSKVRQRLLGTGQPEWAEIAVSDLGRAHPGLRSLVERVDVMRWGHAMVRPTVDFLFGGAREAAADSFQGVHFAHSDMSGLPLFEEAFYRGNRAADAVLATRQGDSK